jgi:hypothetical protein
MEQISYNMLFRWFVGLATDDAAWDASTFSKNRDRLMVHDVVETVRDMRWLDQCDASPSAERGPQQVHLANTGLRHEEVESEGGWHAGRFRVCAVAHSDAVDSRR